MICFTSFQINEVNYLRRGDLFFSLKKTAENKPQNGQWSDWDSWSDCTVSCGGGLRSRNRSCTDPPPENGGDSCIGISLQSEMCNPFMCPGKRMITMYFFCFCPTFFLICLHFIFPMFD